MAEVRCLYAADKRWHVRYTSVIIALCRRSLKMTQYKILQNQHFQSCILIYHKRILCFKTNLSTVYKQAEPEMFDRDGRLDKQAVVFFFCVFTIQYVESGRYLLNLLQSVGSHSPQVDNEGVFGANMTGSFCGYDIGTSPRIMTSSIQTDPKTHSLFSSLFPHACYSYSFTGLISDPW